MTPAARVATAIELVDHLISESLKIGGQPADRLVRAFLSNRRFIGSKDRRWITSAVWGVVRHFGRFQAMCKDGRALDGRAALILWLKLNDAGLNAFGAADTYAPPALTVDEKAWCDALLVQSIDHGIECPADLIPLLPHPSGMLLHALNGEAAVDVRLRDGATLADLPDAEWHAIPGLRDSYRAHQPGQITDHASYRSGVFEIPDAASQIASHLVCAKPGHRVLDLCAGAGGKSLAIADELYSSGSIIALDIIPKRLDILKKRAVKLNLQDRITTRVIAPEGEARARQLKGYREGFDRVLVDAPCSGSGTWRRNPDQKWRTALDQVRAYSQIQQSLFLEASAMTRPGGMMIYLTCSVFPLENDDVVEAGLQAAEDAGITLRPIDYRDLWQEAGLDGAPVESAGAASASLSLRPNTHATDGFFIALFKRSVS